MCAHTHTHTHTNTVDPFEDEHSQCSLFSVPFVEGCPLWEGSMPALLFEPLLRVALLDDVVPLQDAICCCSSVDTLTMHSSEGSEGAAAHELCMWEPMPCRDFMAGVWAIEWMVDQGVWQRIRIRRHDMGILIKCTKKT